MKIIDEINQRILISTKHIEKLNTDTRLNFYPKDAAILSRISREKGKIEALEWIKTELHIKGKP